MPPTSPDESGRGFWPVPIGALWIAIALCAVVGRTLLQPINPEDYWWSLAMGDRVLGAGSVDTNAFLFSLPADAPFHAQAWLAQAAMSVVAGHGHHFSVLLHAVLMLVAWVGIAGIALHRGASASVVGVTAMVAHYIASATVSVRTQMFAYVPFLVVLFAVTRRRAPGAAEGAVVCATTALWANLHGSYVLAPLLVATAAFGAVLEDRRAAWHWGGLLAATMASTAVAPQGLRNLLYPLQVYAVAGHELVVEEWEPVSVSAPQGLIFWLVALGTAAFVVKSRSSIRAREFVTLLPLALIAAVSVRGVLWFAMAWAVVVSPAISLAIDRPRETTSASAGIGHLTAIVALVVAAVSSVPGGPVFGVAPVEAMYGTSRASTADLRYAVLSADTPHGLVARLAERPAVRRVFCDQSITGLVEYEFGVRPEPYLLVDHRLELVPSRAWQDYFAIIDLADDWEERVERLEFDTFVLSSRRSERLIGRLSGSERWLEADRDREWVVFTRAAPHESPGTR